MATKRSKRLEKALSEQGWETGRGGMKCVPCNETHIYGVFCSDCGARLKKIQDVAIFKELEDAIAYALEEKDARGYE